MKCKLSSVYLFLIVALTSCDHYMKIHPVELQDGMYAIDRHGLVKDYAPDLSGNKVYTYLMETSCLITWFGYTPHGKIDQIIAENPEWVFLTYVEGAPEDSAFVRSTLDQYDCDFPVILDTKGRFRKRNSRMNDMALWGGICNKRGEVLGASVVGNSMSFFDSEFEKAKRIMRRYGK